MTPLIKAENISVIKQEKDILKNVTLEISSNDFITIIGPNGAGKSMLLKALMKLIKIDSGNISHKKNLKIGYVPQRLNIHPSMPIKVKDFLKLNKKQISNYNSTIKDTNISHILEKQLHILSGGELQRVLLARALLNKPELLILDEPAQNLDITNQLSFYKLLEKIYKKLKISILMVSHDLHLVMASTSKVVCLYHHICCSGAPQTVTKDPEFISLFGKDMAKMMAVYHHEHDHNHDGDCHA